MKHRWFSVLAIFVGLALSCTPIPAVAQAPDPAHMAAGNAAGLPSHLDSLPGDSAGWWAAVQEEIRLAEYGITWQEQTYLPDLAAAYQAPNRAHNLRTYFTVDGVRLIPRQFPADTPPWELSLALVGYGYAGAPVASPGTPVLHASGNRIDYRYPDESHVVAWYVNSERGLEQGFTLAGPPATDGGLGSSSLVLEVAAGGELAATSAAGGSAVEFAAPGGDAVVHYAGLEVIDAAGRALPALLDVEPQQPGASRAGHYVLRITIDATSARYPITVDPTLTGLSTTPDWTAEGNQDGAYFGSSVATAGDVNGDGYSDVVVGAPLYDNGQTNEGRAFVYHGSAGGLSTTAAWVDESDQADASYGIAVAMAGDVNGDGYADVIVGASYYDDDQVDEGRAYVYHGSASGLAATPAWIADGGQDLAFFGRSVGMAGDVNGDGYDEVVIGASYDDSPVDGGRAYVYHGSASGLSTTPNWTAAGDQASAAFGWSVATAGDVNGDGYADVIVSAPFYTVNQGAEGRVYVYHGSATGLGGSPAWDPSGDQLGAQFGTAVAAAGDVNGDGYGDVVVGAPLYDVMWGDEGRIYVYHGTATGLSTTPALTPDGDQAFAEFGASVAAAGDVNGDGYADVIVGAPIYDSGLLAEGRAFVYHGSASGLETPHAWTVAGEAGYAALGSSVATAGDVNGDGYSDIIVGAPRYDGDQMTEGRAYVYHGGPSSLSGTPAWMEEGDQADAYFGFSAGTAGDVNGDGYGDIVVGAPWYDNGEEDEGRAYVYHGSASGLDTTPAWMTEGDLVYAYFGRSVGTAGDVNGDGYDDVVVGAPYHDDDQLDEGRAYVYHGSASGLAATPDWIADGGQEFAWFGWSVGTAGDVNGDGYGDLVVGALRFDNGQLDEGRAYVYHGSASGLSTTPTWTAESDQADASFGWSVATAGDVNGDGYSDVVVGAPDYDNGELEEGRAYVYHGSEVGPTAAPAWTAEGDQIEAGFGWSVGMAGDVNGDGYGDVVVGAPSYDNGELDEGRAYVYHGSASGLSTTPGWTAESDQADASFGWSVARAGDVDGNGYADVIVGAPEYDAGVGAEGRAYVYHGGPSGVATVPGWTTEGDRPSAHLGHSVATAGDVNGDGYADVVVAAPYYDSISEALEGAAFLYYGNGGDGLDLLPRQMRAGGSAPIAHLAKSDLSTAFQLRLTGRMPLGRQDVRLEWQVAPLGTLFTDPGVLTGMSDWADVGTGGTVISQDVTGLSPGTPYHWRTRLLYRPGNALGQPAGRWVHIPWGGWHEIDLRTNFPPAADAGPDQVTDTLTLVTLDGSASFDPDQDYPLTYAWTQIGGPSVTFTPYLSVTTFTAPDDPAVLTFTLTVTDSLGLPSVPDEVIVTANNQPPVAFAGLDQVVDTLAPVTLDGIESFDWDGDYPLTYAWTQIGGPSVTFTPYLSVTTFTAPDDPAVLTFTLTVTDSLGLPSAPDEVIVTANNQPPVADAGPDQVVDTLAPVTLDGSASFDPDGDVPLAYLWTQTDGPPVTFDPHLAVTTFAAPSEPAVLSFSLIVTDSLGLPAAPDTVFVGVSNQPPVANAGPDQGVTVDSLVTLDGAASSDPDGDLPLAYLWAQTGGLPVVLSDPAAAQASFTAPGTPAVLTFTLTVTDALGLPAPVPDTCVVAVSDAPITGLSLTSNSPTPYGEPTILTATVTSGSNLVFTWDWGDGQRTSSRSNTRTVPAPQVVSHTYAVAGNYTAVVTATNSASTESVSTTVAVVAPPACLVALESVSINGLPTAFTGLTWPFNATVEPAGATAPITYTWSPPPASGQGTPTAAYTWTTSGPVTLTVLAENCGGMASASLGVQVVSDVSIPVDPAITTTIVYTDPQVVTTTIIIPPGAVSDTVTLVFSPNAAPSRPLADGQLFANHAFDLDAYLGEALLPGFVFSTPIHVEVNYTDQDVAGIDEATLQLYYWTGSAWADGATTCSPPSAYRRDLAGNSLSVDVCHLTEWIISGAAPRTFIYRVYLPVTVRHSVVAPDLVVDSLSATGDNVQVVLRNQGNGPVVDEFWVDIYVNPTRAPERVNETWEQLADQGLVWGVTRSTLPLAPGAVLTLTVGDAYFAPEYSHVVWPLAPGTPIYAHVDSAGERPYGGVLEVHEILEEAYNNVLGPVLSLAGRGLAPPVVHSPALDEGLPPRELWQGAP